MKCRKERVKRLLKALNILISIFLIIIAISVAFIAFPQFGNKALIVRSGSMQPAIDVGSIVVTRPIENGTYSKGDIIAFRSEKNSETLITHRVVSVEKGPDGTFYKTKGDANEEVDGWSVSEKNVLGKVGLTIPYAGRVLTFAKSDIGFPTLIIFPALLVIALESWTIIKEIRKRKSNKLSFGFNSSDTINIKVGPSSHIHQGPTFGLKILIPLLILVVAVPGTLAVMKDSETSVGNLIQASNIFPNQSVSPSPTPTPGVEPSTTPTPSPTPSIEPSITPNPTP